MRCGHIAEQATMETLCLCSDVLQLDNATYVGVVIDLLFTAFPFTQIYVWFDRLTTENTDDFRALLPRHATYCVTPRSC